jgi:23S rRNA pseudouridine2605 synthase
VTVNGEVVRELGSKVNPGVDEVRVDGILIVPEAAPSYLMLNKPAGYLTTMDDPQGRPTVRELVPADQIRGLFPVGRLDLDTTGLLLFMTDGELAHRLLHPRRHVPKRYQVLTDGRFTETAAKSLRDGVELLDGMTLPAEVEVGLVSAKKLSAAEPYRLVVDDNFSRWQTEVFCTITEGRKRQVKRMFAHVGFPVLELSRVAFGSLELGDLPEGSWRHLTEDEVQQLQSASSTPE